MKKVACPFSPSQPVLKGQSSDYIEYIPENQNQRNVALYYQFRTDSLGRIPIIPDGCLDLLFCCSSSDPFAVLAVSPEQGTFYQFKKESEYFGVRLYPEQTCLKFKYPVKDFLTKQQVPLFDILDIDLSFLEEIGSQINFRERIGVFKSYMRKIVPSINYDHRLIQYCIGKIYSAEDGCVNIQQLADDAGYSDRYIRKKFDEYIGFSPKKFSQIVRFQQTISEILSPNSNVEELISQRGFYDESHFYKEFKKMAQLSPKKLKSEADHPSDDQSF